MKLLFYHLARSVKNLRRTLVVNSVTIVTVTIALFLLSGFNIISTNINRWIKNSDSQFALKVFLNDDAKQVDINRLQKKLENDTQLVSVVLQRKEDVKASFIAKHPDFSNLLSGVNDNPFPTYFTVELKDSHKNKLKAFGKKLEKDQIVDAVDFPEKWLERFIVLKDLLQSGVWVLTMLIVIGCVFLVSNTIRMNIFARKTEIEILTLIGGTRAFINTPFLVEGALIGLIGGVLAAILAFLFFEASLVTITNRLAMLNAQIQFEFLSFGSACWIILLGVLSGFFGSWFSLRRFVRF